ncbi:MAG: energy-coupling factor ABC transporter permease [Nitrososphaerota archaeon]|jgi:cobalt/nickel transport system permease protein|nr:energy-coupling factor ABC transporter permease [Nitrososphaerota archaeon]
MHLQDGQLTLTIAVPALIITLIFWIIASKKIKLTEQQVPMMGLLTALFFAAMSLNIPVFGGVTVHLLGGAVIGLILGPFAGLISMSIILTLQALLFADGGIIVLGANVLNMGILGVFIPCILFITLNKFFKPKIGNSLYGIIFVSAFFGDLTAAIAAGAEIGISSLHPYGLNITLAAVIIPHSISSTIEGAFAVLIIAILLKLRPDVIEKSPLLGKLSLFKNKTKNEPTKNAKT